MLYSYTGLENPSRTTKNNMVLFEFSSRYQPVGLPQASRPAELRGARVLPIEAQIEETTSNYDREKLQERLTKVAGGAGPPDRDQRR
jgi:hypothetical protein